MDYWVNKINKVSAITLPLTYSALHYLRFLHILYLSSLYIEHQLDKEDQDIFVCIVPIC